MIVSDVIDNNEALLRSLVELVSKCDDETDRCLLMAAAKLVQWNIAEYDIKRSKLAHQLIEVVNEKNGVMRPRERTSWRR